MIHKTYIVFEGKIKTDSAEEDLRLYFAQERSNEKEFKTQVSFPMSDTSARYKALKDIANDLVGDASFYEIGFSFSLPLPYDRFIVEEGIGHTSQLSRLDQKTLVKLVQEIQKQEFE